MDTGAGVGDDGTLPPLSDVSNALVLGPASGEDGRDTCLDIVAQAVPESTGVVVVTYASTPQEWIDGWMDHVGTAPARGGIVSVGQSEDDVGVGQAGETFGTVEGEEVNDRAWLVKPVEDPADLTGIGIELSELLSDVAAADDGDVVVCFDSLTALLGHADLQRAFRFLHVATGRVKNAGATGYYHLDSDAHDDEDRATLTGLFDATVVRENGEWTAIE